MQAKKNLAWGIVRDFHSAAAADAAAENWARQFQQKAVAEDVPVVQVSVESEGLAVEAGLDGAVVRLPKLLVLAGLASSAGEATRKLGEKAVSVDGEKYSDKLHARSEGGGIGSVAAGQEECARELGKVVVKIQGRQRRPLDNFERLREIDAAR